jgi:hypothetical protein
MKAIEATGTINPKGELSLDTPLSIVSSGRVRIIVLVPESETEEIEQSHWSNLTTDQFLSGYSPVDAIYDKI